MSRLIVKGLASQKTVAEFELTEEEMQQDLLTLLTSKGIPIASSCQGEGVCQKCLINGDLMACITKPSELIAQDDKKIEITVSYL
ncbi:MAG: 2Fe-2S iron-sulfur cluster binding domain-containing protein [Deltaproteobacteria bacterium]|nr:MAG: 2Fe-2S iron-sulfur cluster binding domain-containing protein [Deltaproteobacteria bacterium]